MDMRSSNGDSRSPTPAHNSNSVSDFSYRNLIVWQKAMSFSKLVYSCVRTFPVEERYALSDQIRRAAVSVASNIAEGAGRLTNKDYAHFLGMARGSLYETMTQIEMARSFGYLDEQKFTEMESLAAEISRMLTTLIKKYTPFSHSNS